MNYALIGSNGTVINVIVLENKLSDFPNAIPLNGRPVSIGDLYKSESFWRDGKRILTPHESELSMLEQRMTAIDLERIYASQSAGNPKVQLLDMQMHTHNEIKERYNRCGVTDEQLDGTGATMDSIYAIKNYMTLKSITQSQADKIRSGFADGTAI